MLLFDHLKWWRSLNSSYIIRTEGSFDEDSINYELVTFSHKVIEKHRVFLSILAELDSNRVRDRFRSSQH